MPLSPGRFAGRISGRSIALLVVLGCPLTMAWAQGAKPAAAGKPGKAATAAPAATVPAAKLTPEQRTQQILETPVSVEFVKRPLLECLQTLCDKAKVTLKMDRQTLEDEGVDVQEPVSLKLTGVKFRSVATLLLNDLYCGWSLNNETLQVTTIMALKQEVRSYAVADLETSGLLGDEFLEAIEASVLPESWKSVGGESSLRLDDGRLIVTQTQPGHDGVDRLLQQLREAMSRAAKAPADKSRPNQPPTALRKALKVSVTRVLEDVPLATALEQLLPGENYVLRRHVLEQIGFDLATPVSAKFTDIPTDSALTFLLDEVKLVWFVDDDVLYVTTASDAPHFMQSRVFPIRNLAPGEKPTEDLLKKLQANVEPDSWAEAGGCGSAIALPGFLVVAHAPQTQRAVEEFVARQPVLKK